MRALPIVLCVLSLLGLLPQGAAQGSARRLTPTVEAVAKVSPAVVNISTQKVMSRRAHPLDSFFDFGTKSDRRRGLRNHSLGSGVIVDAKGYIVTNDHVVRQADQIIVGLADGREIKARLVGRNSDHDIAILCLEGKGPFPTAQLARSNDLLLGETTIALGNPFGLGGSVTQGILSAWNRSVDFNGKRRFEDFLQTSAVINPGNSGGPLCNLDGDVIGINVAIHSRGPGISFAIPVARVRNVLYELLDPTVARRLDIGLDVDHRDEGYGAKIIGVDQQGPAALAGLVQGDRIMSLGTRRVRDWIDFLTTVDSAREGDEFKVTVDRGGQRIAKKLKVVRAPYSQGQREVFQLMGFEFEEVKDAENEGIVVTRVLKGSSADEIGIQAGDIVYQLGGYSVDSTARTQRILSAYLKRRTRSIQISLFRPEDEAHLRGKLALKRARATQPTR